MSVKKVTKITVAYFYCKGGHRMENLDFSNKEAVNWWENKKEELLDGIEQVLENKDSEVQEEILSIMKSLVENARIRTSMSNYFEDIQE